MTLWRTAVWLIGIGFFVVLGSLQFIKPIEDYETAGFLDHFQNNIYPNRLILSIILGLGYACISGWSGLLLPKENAKKIRLTIMEAMREELFNNDKVNIRITIFKDANFFRRFVILIWGFYVRIFKDFRRVRIKLFKEYIFTWERLGRLHHYTYLDFDSTDENKCVGIASVARHRETTMFVVDLPNLDEINLAELDEIDIKRNTKMCKNIRKYMEESYLRGDLETLKRIRRISRHIYGDALYDKTGKFKGVLVIDSFGSESPFNESVLENMPYYLKIIGATL